jgi:phospholipid/cholesterol/gamma-HCH transport system ATP-binding protein
MNSVMGIGENIIFIYQGHKLWEGTKDDIFHVQNKELEDFIFASKLFKKVRDNNK